MSVVTLYITEVRVGTPNNKKEKEDRDPKKYSSNVTRSDL